MKPLHRLLVCAACLLAAATPVRAQDVLAAARDASPRADGIALLETHLAATAGDVDARLLYGLMLSWEGRYDEARRELQRVLAQSPTYTDARAGLMNVEWWSGNLAAARDLSHQILASEPGHVLARLIRQRLGASERPWSVGLSTSYDRFSDDGRAPWQEHALTLSRETKAGPVIFRGSRADRFGMTDEQIEVEFYPTFRPGTYAFIGIGVSPDHALFPENRLAVDLFQNVGHGFEVSGGYRRLGFAETTAIYLATISKYIGNWMLTGKVYHVPGRDNLDSTSGHVAARRYYGADGTSFVGLGYSHGLSREEIRGAGDLLALDSDTLRAHVDSLVGKRFRVQFEASTSRQQRTSGSALWQNTLGAGFVTRF